MPRLFPRLLPGLMALAMFWACSEDPVRVAGGWTDTETGPKVTGVIKREDGTGAAGALVLLRPSDYLGKDPSLPDSLGVSAAGGSVIDVLCDSTGAFAFDSVARGGYLLESRDREIKAVSVRFGVDRERGRLALQPAVVRHVGAVAGRVRFGDGTSGRVLVRIFGLERAAVTDASGAYFFGNVPAGNYILHFSGIDPFILPSDLKDIRVLPNATTDAGEVSLQRVLKQSFRITDGFLELPGIDSTNPLVFENGIFWNPVDGAYLWAKASMGHLNLRGTIVTYGGVDTGFAVLQANLRNYARLSRTAQNSGIRGMLDAVPGARRMLARAPGGRLEDIRPDTTEGALLLIREARKATPARPLVFVSGANLTTAAEALLIDPAIADRMVILGANNGNFNDGDSLALALVSRKARFVEWSRDYLWPGTGIDWTRRGLFLPNPLGDGMRSIYGRDTVSPGLKSSGFYGDFGAATFLFRRDVWRNARAMDFGGPPLIALASTRSAFDFVDIPAAANDWEAIQEEFFSTITSQEAYHPWALLGQIEAEAYSGRSGIAVDSSAEEGEEVAVFKATGSWTEYCVQADAAGVFAMEFRYRCLAPSRLKVSDPASGDSVLVDLPGAPAWGSIKADLPMGAGVRTLRMESAQGAFELNWLRTVPR
ncbi:MAG: carbohydrate-binding protein [Fibrobacteres bacterium]|nr:carbohydrate-binding protein [Fibrobacterota bacterium]